jgi:hypothetical protein
VASYYTTDLRQLEAIAETTHYLNQLDNVLCPTCERDWEAADSSQSVDLNSVFKLQLLLDISHPDVSDFASESLTVGIGPAENNLHVPIDLRGDGESILSNQAIVDVQLQFV